MVGDEKIEIKKHMLYLVYGPSGAGKTQLVEMVERLGIKSSFHVKDTTRPSRIKEQKQGSRDLNFVTEIDPHDSKYAGVYEVYDYRSYYGIKKADIEQAKENEEVHFVIVSNVDGLRQLKKVYPEAIVVYMYTYSMKDVEQLMKRESEEITVSRRRARIMKMYDDYVRNNMLFDHVIINSEDLESTLDQLENMIRYYNEG